MPRYLIKFNQPLLIINKRSYHQHNCTRYNFHSYKISTPRSRKNPYPIPARIYRFSTSLLYRTIPPASRLNLIDLIIIARAYAARTESYLPLMCSLKNKKDKTEKSLPAPLRAKNKTALFSRPYSATEEENAGEPRTLQHTAVSSRIMR